MKKVIEFPTIEMLDEDTVRQIQNIFDGYVFFRCVSRQEKQVMFAAGFIRNDKKRRAISSWMGRNLKPEDTFSDAVEKVLKHSKFLLVTNVPTPILLHFVRKAAVQTRTFQPEHDVFLGIAYCHGIVVRKNIKRMLECYKRAAAANSQQAIQLLVFAFQYGDGVEESLRSAYHWQKKLVALRTKAFQQQEKTTKDINELRPAWLALFSCQLEMYYICRDRKDYMAAQRTINSMLRFSYQMKSDEHLEMSYKKQGDIYRMRGKNRKALSAYLKSLSYAPRPLKYRYGSGGLGGLYVGNRDFVELARDDGNTDMAKTTEIKQFPGIHKVAAIRLGRLSILKMTRGNIHGGTIRSGSLPEVRIFPATSHKRTTCRGTADHQWGKTR